METCLECGEKIIGRSDKNSATMPVEILTITNKTKILAI
jgi:hypothetical protein